MNGDRMKHRYVYFLMGALIATACFLLIGATDVSAPNYGRYQISSWSTPVGKNGFGVGAFVVDTATGETKMVFNRIYREPELNQNAKEDLRKFFHTIR
jgi:hypothetical protein